MQSDRLHYEEGEVIVSAVVMRMQEVPNDKVIRVSIQQKKKRNNNVMLLTVWSM